jgi:hypothetical protein
MTANEMKWDALNKETEQNDGSGHEVQCNAMN